MDRRAEHLPHALPVPEQVVDERAERARAAAQQPAEHDAAPDVEQAPAPLLEWPEQLERLRRQQAPGHRLGDEWLEDAIGQRDLVVARRRDRLGFLAQIVGRLCPLEVLLEERSIYRQQLLEDRLKILGVD
jgi:hypothetical protein